MDAYAEVRERFDAFARGKISLDEFQDWLVPFSWEIESRGVPLAVRPVRRIQLFLAEHSRGHRTLRFVRAEVKAILRESPATAETPTMVREGTTEVAVKRKIRRPARRPSTKR